MELVIVLCLLMVILLLISDKVEVKRIIYKKDEGLEEQPEPDIMGKTKSSLVIPKADKQDKNQNQEVKPDSFTQESNTHENVEDPILQEEQEIYLSALPDFEQEEEELRRFSIDEQNNGFTQGVTFEELRTVEKLLQEENPEPSQKETAVAIVQKIHGTELFSLLESSMETASEKIAKLLDPKLSIEKTSGSYTMQDKGIEDFDIGEFV